MSIVSFEDYRPAERFDDIPWTHAQIDEAETPAGPWATIDTITLDPVDDDPSDPQSRSFTTANASDTPSLWYRVTFLDADEQAGLPTTPIQNALLFGIRDLCTLARVTSYVPGYEPSDMTDAKLRELITAESELIPSESGREIVGPSAVETRTFEISRDQARRRVIDIGDLATLDDATISIRTWDDQQIRALTGDDIVPLYDRDRQPTNDWAPITALELPAIRLVPGTILKIEDATWGFRRIPSFVAEACAKRVILRYVSDVAASGTDFAQAISEGDLNLAAMFASSQDALEQLEITGGVMIS